MFTSLKILDPQRDQHGVVFTRRLEALVFHLRWFSDAIAHSNLINNFRCGTQFESEFDPKFPDLARSKKLMHGTPRLNPASSPQTQFNHRSLSEDHEARILFLEQGNHDDELKCYLRHVKSLQDQEYEALSYVWGEIDGENTMLCEGEPLYITPNLAAALTRLRSADRPRALWVDAICINQEDKKEKTQQVQKMGHIFANATQVIIWLGDELGSDCLAFDSLKRLQSGISNQVKGSKNKKPELGHTNNSDITHVDLTENHVTRLQVAKSSTQALSPSLVISPSLVVSGAFPDEGEILGQPLVVVMAYGHCLTACSALNLGYALVMTDDPIELKSYKEALDTSYS
ncbi:hypothetical protein B7463_g12600, partial [Scytalidium lignicola]